MINPMEFQNETEAALAEEWCGVGWSAVSGSLIEPKIGVDAMRASTHNARMKTICIIPGGFPSTRKFTFKCEAVVNGFAVNPVLGDNFDSTPNEERSDRQMAWWGVPFIRTERNFWTEDSMREQFRAKWGGDIRYDVRCLDGGAWDRSTWWGSFATLEEAAALAESNKPVYMP